MACSMEIKNSHLRLESKSRNCGIKTYNLQWMVPLLKRDKIYFGPRVQIGKFVCKLICNTRIVEFADDSLTKCVYLGLVPCPKFATVNFTILSPDGGIQRGDESLLEFAPFLANGERFFAFKVASNTTDLVAYCAIETDLPDDGDFVCNAVCAEERCTMLADMEQLLRDKKHCDINLVIGDRTFKAHKAILYARSSYLAEILRNDNPQELVEELKNIDSVTFEELLYFIYTQKTKKYSFEMALQLLPLSVKFKLEYLKLFLMDHLIGCMSVGYALWLVVNAHRHQDTELKNCALECIGNNLKDALKRQEWNEFRNYKELVDQLFHYLAVRSVRLKN